MFWDETRLDTEWIQQQYHPPPCAHAILGDGFHISCCRGDILDSHLALRIRYCGLWRCYRDTIAWAGAPLPILLNDRATTRYHQLNQNLRHILGSAEKAAKLLS